MKLKLINILKEIKVRNPIGLSDRDLIHLRTLTDNFSEYDVSSNQAGAPWKARFELDLDDEPELVEAIKHFLKNHPGHTMVYHDTDVHHHVRQAPGAPPNAANLRITVYNSSNTVVLEYVSWDSNHNYEIGWFGLDKKLHIDTDNFALSANGDFYERKVDQEVNENEEDGLTSLRQNRVIIVSPKGNLDAEDLKVAFDNPDNYGLYLINLIDKNPSMARIKQLNFGSGLNMPQKKSLLYKIRMGELSDRDMEHMKTIQLYREDSDDFEEFLETYNFDTANNREAQDNLIKSLIKSTNLLKYDDAKNALVFSVTGNFSKEHLMNIIKEVMKNAGIKDYEIAERGEDEVSEIKVINPLNLAKKDAKEDGDLDEDCGCNHDIDEIKVNNPTQPLKITEPSEVGGEKYVFVTSNIPGKDIGRIEATITDDGKFIYLIDDIANSDNRKLYNFAEKMGIPVKHEISGEGEYLELWIPIQYVKPTNEPMMHEIKSTKLVDIIKSLNIF